LAVAGLADLAAVGLAAVADLGPVAFDRAARAARPWLPKADPCSAASGDRLRLARRRRLEFRRAARRDSVECWPASAAFAAPRRDGLPQKGAAPRSADLRCRVR